MEKRDFIKQGEWLCAPGGLAVVEKVCNLYYEEYDFIPENNKIIAVR